MTMHTAASWIEALSYEAADFRLPAQTLLDGTGVVALADLAVTANSTPNMTINIAAGQVWIPGTLGATGGMQGNNSAQSPSLTSFTQQGSYYALNDGVVNLSLAASDPTNPRIDVVYAAIEDAQYSGASNQAVLGIATGTPAGSPVAPAVPANAVSLADIVVAATTTTIVQGNISDARAFACGNGASGFGGRFYRAAPYVPVAAALTQFPFDSVGWDDVGGFDAATGAYYVRVEGVYEVKACINFTGTTPGDVYYLSTQYNATTHNYGPYGAAGSNLALAVADEIRCIPGDHIAVAYYCEAAPTGVSAGAAYTYMTVGRRGRS